MRTVAAILFIGLCSCHQKQADPRAVLSCMESKHSNDDYLLMTGCEPLGTTERMAGTWFVGLELSRFKEGRPSRGDRLFQYHELIVPAALNGAVHKSDSGLVSTYDIVFLGRPSRLQMKSEPTTLVADKLISIRRVQTEVPPPR